MLNRFTLDPSTYSTFAMLGNSSKEIISFLLIWDLLPYLNVTLPHFFGLNFLKRERSLVICLEHSLSRYHRNVFITLRALCIIKHTSCLLVKLYDRILSLWPLLDNLNRAFIFPLPSTRCMHHLRQSSILLHFLRINSSFT